MKQINDETFKEIIDTLEFYRNKINWKQDNESSAFDIIKDDNYTEVYSMCIGGAGDFHGGRRAFDMLKKLKDIK